MNEYPLHTNPPKEDLPRDYEKLRHILLSLTPYILAIVAGVVAIVSHPEDLAHAQELEKVRSIDTDKVSTLTMMDYLISQDNAGQIQAQMNDNQLASFVGAVQELVNDEWEVEQVSMNGTVEIKVGTYRLSCAALDTTQGDNDFPAFDSIDTLSKVTGINPAYQTLVVEDQTISPLSAEMEVKEDSLIWVCPQINPIE